MNAAYMMEARDGFFERVDSLKKNKTINSTLELTLYTDDKALLQSDDFCDWFLVSGKGAIEASNKVLGEFKIGEKHFIIAKSAHEKCPRCWKYNSVSAETLCPRCEAVISKL